MAEDDFCIKCRETKIISINKKPAVARALRIQTQRQGGYYFKF
jgi:hypothetical protein